MDMRHLSSDGGVTFCHDRVFPATTHTCVLSSIFRRSGTTFSSSPPFCPKVFFDNALMKA